MIFYYDNVTHSTEKIKFFNGNPYEEIYDLIYKNNYGPRI
ncbi:hypothetical protein XNA1_890016 [Xenorhabdus nematophila str. Anatoliense]|nr:hypothetical protein XNA1_4380016 [Xenorhabdus nematophila str. Anatoliense]CEE95953.1 hypothetical protein XNA1_890016 [Xenorhabdus nematophila str. Anatoliense]